VLRTVDIRTADHLSYFVTARRPQTTLQDRLRRKHSLPVRDALLAARAIAAELAHAHEHQVYHGDRRTKYVGLTGDGAVVSGFGVIERVTDVAEGSGATTIVALGSPVYLSPEQASGEVHADPRSDKHAFGCVLFEKLARQPPLGRIASVSRMLTERSPPLQQYRERAGIRRQSYRPL
jgi:serine/threonine-protein kinase